MPRQRDYKAEYTRRIARGLARGLSRSQARGHPKAEEKHLSSASQSQDYDPRLEQGLKGMRRGTSLTASARLIGVSPERLRRYLANARVVEKKGRRWVVADDTRFREVGFYSDGKFQVVAVAGYAQSALIGRYMSAVRQFLITNNPDHLEPFEGEGVTDNSGQFHQFETRPNFLYRLDAAGSETFEQVYRIVV